MPSSSERHGLDISSAPEDVQAVLNRVMHLEDEVKRLRAYAEFKDLRGQTVREVHRDDVVVITGAEWMRMRRAEIEKANDEFDWPAHMRGEDEG